MRVAHSLLVFLALVPVAADASPHHKKPKKPKKPTPAATEPAATTLPDPDTSAPTAPTASGTTAPGTGPTTPTTASPAVTPPPTPPPPTTTAADPTTVEPEGADAADVDSLRQEYLSLRDELFRSRARASAVAGQLYSTRIQVKLTYTTARYYTPTKATIRLDGATIYDNAEGAIGGDDGIRFDGYVAPGRHLVTFHIEATGKDDDSFTSISESQIVVKAVAGKDLVVAAKAKDGGDIAYEWKRKEQGSYQLGLDVSVKTQARAKAAK